MSHTFTAYFLFGYFNTATVANNSFVTDSFVFSAMAFIILYRSENPFAKQTVTFGFIGPVIDGFGFQHFTA